MGKLSLCMIVRDEEKNLDKCLSLARPHVDEIVIVDTGSVDGTVEIAKKYADIFEEIEWPESFAIARNYSMDLATGSHILILDGDEYIDHEGTWKNIRKMLTVEYFVAGMLKQINTSPTQRNSWDQLRIFKNTPEIRYTGIIHEQIDPSVHDYALSSYMLTGHKAQIRTNLGFIAHVGYDLTQDEARFKYTKRLPLHRMIIADAPSKEEKSLQTHHYAVALYQLGMYKKACRQWDLVNFDLLPNGFRYPASYTAAYGYIKVGKLKKASSHVERCFALCPYEPSAHCLAAQMYLEEGDNPNGLLFLLQAFMISTGEQTGRTQVNPHAIKHNILEVYRKFNAKSAKSLENTSIEEFQPFVLKLLQKHNRQQALIKV